MKKIALSIIMAFILSGCTASTFNEMTNDDRYEKREYQVAENYQAVFKRALDKSRECHEMGNLTAVTVAEGQIYSNSNRAELSIYLLGGLGKSMYHGATFEMIDTNKTNMTIYSRFGGEWFNVLSKEFSGECKACFCEDQKK